MPWSPFSSLRLLALLTVIVPSIAHAAWVPDGVPVGAADGVQRAPVATVDGVDGAIIAWVDQRAVSPGIYAQHVRFDGTMAWTLNGVLLSGTTSVNPPRIVPDAAGGAIVVWPTTTAIMAQRIDAGGTLHAGWPANGKVITTDLSGIADFDAATDGTGGAYITRHKTTPGGGGFPPIQTVYLTHVDADGNFAPGWTATNVSRSSDATAELRLEPDGSGGVLWGTNWWFEAGTQPHHGQAERRLADATQAYAFEPGNPFAGLASDGVFHIAAAPDGGGGSYWTWWGRAGGTDHYYGGHSNSTGIMIFNLQTVPFSELAVQDGVNGVFLVGRPAGTNRLEVHRLAPNGTLPAPWTSAGYVVSNPTALGGVAAKPQTGAVLACWSEKTGASFDIRAIVVNEDQTLGSGWGGGGNPICTATGDQNAPALALTSSSAIACWEDQRAGAASQDVYALLVSPSPPVAVEVSLAGSDVGEGFVRLTWFAAGGGLTRATVERSTTGDWEARSTIAPDGNDMLTFEDREVVAGARYGYRLTWTEADGVHRSAETWLDIPAAALAIVGFGPSMRDPSVMMDLASDAPATVDVLDVLGRRVAGATVASASPGRRSVALTARVPLGPGVYVIRLTQAGRAVTKKGVLVSP